MNTLVIILTILIPTIELGNLCKEGDNLSLEAFILISITATVVSTIYTLKVKKQSQYYLRWMAFLYGNIFCIRDRRKFI